MRKGTLAAVVWAAWLVGAGAGCRAEVKGSADMRSVEQDERRWEEPEAPSETAMLAMAATPGASAHGASPAPLPQQRSGFWGVARDLSLSLDVPRAATCRCLAVVAGAPNDARFSWQGSPPANAAGAVAIAISGEGVPCAGHAAAPRASIAGVGRDGGDVVLTVENVSEGTPIMRGALVPQPAAGAHLVVRGRGGASYGEAGGQRGACRLDLH